MHITIFIGGLSGGGAEKVACNLANFLVKENKVTILTLSPPSNSDYSINEKVERVELINSNKFNTSNFILKNTFRWFALRKYLKTKKSNVFVTMLPGTINLLLINRKIIKAPIIISERGDPFKRYNSSKIQKQIMKLLYPKADGYVFQTPDALKYYKEIIKEGIIIPNAVNENENFNSKNVLNENENTFIAVGRLNKQKNYPLMITAFAEVSKKYPEYKLKIFGEGSLKKELKDLILSLNLNNVELCGFSKEINKELSNASIFLMTSDYEGMPNALIEAMSIGLPVISTDCSIGGPRSLIDHKKNGLLIEVGSKEQLIDSMTLLIENKKFAYQIGNEAKKISTDLHPNKIYQKWSNYIKEIEEKYEYNGI